MEEIETLFGVGLAVKGTRPILECLSHHEAGDAGPVLTYAESCGDLPQNHQEIRPAHQGCRPKSVRCSRRTLRWRPSVFAGGSGGGSTHAAAHPAVVVGHTPTEPDSDLVGWPGSHLPSLALTVSSCAATDGRWWRQVGGEP